MLPFPDFKIALFLDSFIYWEKIVKKSNDWKNSVYVIVPLRLGLEQINKEYLHQIKRVFTIPQTVGFVGGKEHYALYFVGLVEDHLLYLDPHMT